MRDLGLMLATAGQPLLMERRRAHALVTRYAEARNADNGGLLARGLRALGLSKAERADGPATPQAWAPRVSWAPDAPSRNGYAIIDRIAVIDVVGFLTPDGYWDWWEECFHPGYAQIDASIRMARSDPDVDGLFIRFDSPGGVADVVFELARSIREGRQAAGGKPVHAHVQWACSAAYAIASGCDRIDATAQGYTGSIGVLVLHVDESGWLDKIGLKTEAIESAPGKTAGASWKPLDDAARADIQADVDQIASDFIACVAAGRGLIPEAIRAQNARIFLSRHADPARSAEAVGLIDGVASEREAFDALVQSIAALKATTIPSPLSGPGASRAKGTSTRLSHKEETMGLKAKMSALRAKAAAGDDASQTALDDIEAVLADEEMSSDDKLSKIEEICAGAEEETPEEDASEDPADEAGAPAAKSKANKAKASTDGFAVLDLPEAAGREKLAAQLGRKVAAGNLTLKDAQSLLAVSPKAGRLSSAMAGRDTQIGVGGGKPSSANALADSMKAMLKRQGVQAS